MESLSMHNMTYLSYHLHHQDYFHCQSLHWIHCTCWSCRWTGERGTDGGSLVSFVSEDKERVWDMGQSQHSLEASDTSAANVLTCLACSGEIG